MIIAIKKDIILKKLYEGRNSYCNLIIDSEFITNAWDDENCEVYLIENKKCVTFKYKYKINNNKKICLSEEESFLETSSIYDKDSKKAYYEGPDISNKLSTEYNLYKESPIENNISSELTTENNLSTKSNYPLNYLLKIIY